MRRCQDSVVHSQAYVDLQLRIVCFLLFSRLRFCLDAAPDYCLKGSIDGVRQIVWHIAFAQSDVVSASAPGDASGFCFSASSCAGRSANLTGSSQFPFTLFPGGLFSPFAEQNPNFYKFAALTHCFLKMRIISTRWICFF